MATSATLRAHIVATAAVTAQNRLMTALWTADIAVTVYAMALFLKIAPTALPIAADIAVTLSVTAV